MKWIECGDCGEEFRVICDSGIVVSYCPICGSAVDDDEEYEEDYE